MKLFIILAVLGIAVVAEGDESVVASVQWPQNDHSSAGAIVNFAYSDIRNGSCIVQLPSSVLLFHTMNAHIVTETTSPSEGRYNLVAPAHWEGVNGTIRALVIFERDNIFNMTDIEFRCDTSDEQLVSVYSFPANILQDEASSNVHYVPGFHKGDELIITLPEEVARFNITGADSRWTIEKTAFTTTVTGFQNEAGIDEQKEVHFSLNYAEGKWFSAGDISVSVGREEVAPEE